MISAVGGSQYYVRDFAASGQASGKSPDPASRRADNPSDTASARSRGRQDFEAAKADQPTLFAVCSKIDANEDGRITGPELEAYLRRGDDHRQWLNIGCETPQSSGAIRSGDLQPALPPDSFSALA